jgi:hypothetical protein
MDARYTPFDITVWLIFLGFWMCVYSIVRWYHRKYPGYPEALSASPKRNPVTGESVAEEKDLEAGTNIS